MDEHELETLFRQAPGEPPPPTFTERDVAAASRRATMRRRSVTAAVSACVVLLLGGVSVVGLGQRANTGGDSGAASAPAYGDAEAEAGEQEQPGGSAGRLPNAQGFPDGSPKQGGEASGENGPRAGRTSGCEKVDRELAIALAGELPVTAGADAVPGLVCPEPSRSAAYAVDGGLVSAVLVPSGVASQLPEQPEGTVIAEERTAAGATVVVLSTPAPDKATAPLAGGLQGIATALARQL
ncbi:hypothetical protein [Qaidamihabitans albus]|uniref:hypothetical protein n=1 Tax=Qaidamihabitans albus TaxID=2795733 RepID=UPI0018F22917|nr:hypothetical protein [Qaidamihabitans albus]